MQSFYFILLDLFVDIMSSASNESNFRTAAYEAITSYLTQATPDAISVVQNTVVTILQRMEQLLSVQVHIFIFSLSHTLFNFCIEPNPWGR